MKKILIKIYIVISILLFISLIILSVMGSKERICYLGDFGVIYNKSYSNNYVYNVKINYYDKIFRNSDIYGVYLNTNSLPDYVKEIKMNDEFGTPFGTLVSKIKLEDKLDNVKYYLKIKVNIFVLITFMFIISILFIIFYNSKYLNQIMIMLLFVLFLFILFNISVSLIHVLIILLSILVLLASKKIRYFFSNNELKSRYFKIIFIFLSFLLIPGIVYTSFSFLFDKNNYENRLKEKRPILSMNNLYKYHSMYETYFNDYIPFRNELIKLKRTLDILLFNRIPLYRSSYGIDRNEFWNSNINDYFGIVNINTNDLLKAKNNLLKFQKKLEEKNIDFVLMVAPSKVVVYDDKFPHLIKKIGNITTTELILKYLGDNLDIDIVYPKNELIKYKDDYQLYWKNDPHWNTLAAYISYKYLMKELNILDTLNDIKNIKMTKISNRIEMNKVNNTYLDNIDYDYFIENFSTNKIIDIEDKRYFYRKSTSINKINAIFVIDSFGMYMRNFMDNNFTNVTTVVLNYNQDFNFNTNFYIDKDTNIIILETVEHLLLQRLLNLF